MLRSSAAARLARAAPRFVLEMDCASSLSNEKNFRVRKSAAIALNPLSWPVLRRLGVAHKIRQAQYSALDRVEFINVQVNG